MVKKTIVILFSLTFLLLYLFQEENKTSTILTHQKLIDHYLEQKQPMDLFGILEIPSLNINQPIYPKDHKENRVDKHVMLLESQDTFLAFAAHSGNGPHAYFRELDQLKKEDKIIIKSIDQTKEYQYFRKEEVLKNGSIAVIEYPFSYLVLITCSKTNDKIQEVFYAKLTKIY